METENNVILVQEVKKTKVDIALYIMMGIVALLIAIPIPGTVLLWGPLDFVSVILAIVCLCKEKYIAGVIGLLWSILFIWIWWVISVAIMSLLWAVVGGA